MLGLSWGYVGIMENKWESTTRMGILRYIIYREPLATLIYIGIMENNIRGNCYRVLGFRDNGE